MSWGDAHYFVARRKNNMFTVAKFTDDIQPEHIATVNLNRQTVVFDFWNRATQSTIDKYIGIVNRFVQDGEPDCVVYMVDEYDHVRSNRYGL